MIMRPPTRPSTITLSPLSVHRCVESDSERASDLTHEASSHAAPRHATCCRHSRTSGSDGRRVADERPNKLRVQRQRLRRRRPRPPHHPAWPPRARSIAAVEAVVAAVAVVAAAKEPRRSAAARRRWPWRRRAWRHAWRCWRRRRWQRRAVGGGTEGLRPVVCRC